MDTLLLAADGVDLDATLSCGQAFRWRRRPDGAWDGVVGGRKLTVRAQDGGLLARGPDVRGRADVRGREQALRAYFDLDRDYAALRALFSTNPTLRRAVAFAPGLRLLRQEPWEALASFVLSQNNNIARLRGLIERLCEQFGEQMPGGGRRFPSARRLCGLNVADLAPLRCGYRAGYLLDAAQKVAAGEIDLAAARELPLEQARAMLRRIDGVGPKVADCTLLYGCGRLECVPMDVWIRRVMEKFYPRGLPRRFRPAAGVAQLYLFHYARHLAALRPARGRRPAREKEAARLAG